MKFYFISENKFYLSLLVLFFFTTQCVVTINASNSCNNTCSSKLCLIKHAKTLYITLSLEVLPTAD